MEGDNDCHLITPPVITPTRKINVEQNGKLFVNAINRKKVIIIIKEGEANTKNKTKQPSYCNFCAVCWAH